MNLIIHNRVIEDFKYLHKKFDQGKRPREDVKCLLGDRHFVSDDAINFYRFSQNIQPPILKKPKVIDSVPAIPYGFHSNYEFDDSGISSTPQSFYTSTPDKSLYDANIESSMTAETANISNASTPSPSRTIASVLPNINEEILRNICKYHGNMVRQFPKKQRSPKDQERRDKNTLACRISRRVKKLEHIALEEQCKEYADRHFDIVQESIRATAYLNELTTLIAVRNNAKIMTSLPLHTTNVNLGQSHSEIDNSISHKKSCTSPFVECNNNY